MNGVDVPDQQLFGPGLGPGELSFDTLQVETHTAIHVPGGGPGYDTPGLSITAVISAESRDLRSASLFGGL